MQRQADIEIHVETASCPMPALLAWIEASVGPLGPTLHGGGEVWIYFCPIGPVVVTGGLHDGHFTSVWFHSDQTPWATDMDCAVQAAQVLGCWVACSTDVAHRTALAGPLSDWNASDDGLHWG